jgi:nucleoside-diphosphate-sugar epimerase
MFKSRNVLVLGSTGFIGRNIVEILHEKNHVVHPVIRRESVRREELYNHYVKKGVEPLIIKDIDEKDLSKIILEKNIDVVVNSIGLLRGSRERLYEAHVETSRRILRGIIYSENKDLLYIHISSTAASDISREKPLAEEKIHCSHIDDLKTSYEKTKCEGEILVRDLCERHGINYVILRPNIVIGRYNRHDEWIFLNRISRLGVHLDLDIKTNITDVKDLVEIINLLFYRKDLYNDYYHIVSPKEISVKEISRIFLEVLNKRSFVRIGERSIRITRLLKIFLRDEMLRRFIDVLSEKDLRISSDKFIKRSGYIFKDPVESFVEYVKWLNNL